MSLNWNVNDVKWPYVWVGGTEDGMGNITFTGKPEDPKFMNPVINTLIWATMAVGIGSITEENWREFAARMEITERLNGPFLKVSSNITPDKLAIYGLTEAPASFPLWVVKECIGLKTNVTNETRSAWSKRKMAGALSDAKRVIENIG